MLQIVNFYVGLVGFLSFSILCSSVEFPPPPLTKCHATDESCFIDQVNKYLKTYAGGLPEQNIQPLEPLLTEDIVIKGDENSPTNFNLRVSDMKIYNITTSKITSVKGLSQDKNKPIKWMMTLSIPELTYTGKYAVNGKLLVFPIVGQGDSVMHIYDVNVKLILTFKSEKRDDGKTYLEVDDIKLSTDAKSVKMFLSNLFNGDKELSNNVLKVMNDNWRLFKDDFDKPVFKALTQVAKDVANKLLKNVPYEDFFLKDEN